MTPIRIEGVSKSFGPARALLDVTLHVEAGEMFFLLGPSGCGKTTLLRIVAGLETPDVGRIYFGDEDITGLEASRREAVMMFQSYALWPHMTVEGNVGFGLAVRKVPRPKAREAILHALEQVHMAHLAGRRPGQLSGGQQQRVALARALVVRPRVLLLDEPLSNLDAGLRAEMRHEIRALCSSAGLTALYVTHDQHEAMAIADRIAIVREGRIEQVGAPREIYDRPVNRFVAAFMGPANVLPGTMLGASDPARVETPVGVLGAARQGARGDTREGAKVLVSIRHEAFVILPASVQAGAGIEGRVVASSFMGDRTHYEIEAGAGTRIEATAQGSGTSLPVAGDRVILRVDPRDVVLLPHEEG